VKCIAYVGGQGVPQNFGKLLRVRCCELKKVAEHCLRATHSAVVLNNVFFLSNKYSGKEQIKTLSLGKQHVMSTFAAALEVNCGTSINFILKLR